MSTGSASGRALFCFTRFWGPAQGLWYTGPMDRVIFHVDVNSAFLSWSAVRKLKDDPDGPDLRTIPSAVGGDVKTRHGIITAASLPAKRMGVKTGEPVVKALQKCPDLVLVPSDFVTYRDCSRRFIAILRTWSEALEQVSIDEAYLDMTGLEGKFRDLDPADGPFPLNAAAGIRRQIRETLGFTVNVGISSNKLLAKMASDLEKPDKTHTLYPDEVEAKMWPLPIRDLHGCGGATAERLRSLGIVTIGDAARTDPEILKSALGEKAGEYISRASRGISSSPVHTERDKAKSYSNETTLAEDITADNYEEVMLPLLDHLSEKVSGRLRRDGVRASTIGVIVKTGTFRRHTRQQALVHSTDREVDFKRISKALMDALLRDPDRGLFILGESVRLVGVSASGLDDGTYEQMSLFDFLGGGDEPPAQGTGQEEAEGTAVAEAETEGYGTEAESPEAEAEGPAESTAGPDPGRQREEKRKRLSAMMDAIQARYGSGAIRRGTCPAGTEEDRPGEETEG